MADSIASRILGRISHPQLISTQRLASPPAKRSLRYIITLRIISFVSKKKKIARYFLIPPIRSSVYFRSSTT